MSKTKPKSALRRETSLWVTLMLLGLASSLFFNVRDAFLVAERAARTVADAAIKAGAGSEEVQRILADGPDVWELVEALAIAVLPIVFAAILSEVFLRDASTTVKTIVLLLFVAAIGMSLVAHIEVIAPDRGLLVAVLMWLTADVAILVSLHMINLIVKAHKHGETVARLTADIERWAAGLRADKLAALEADIEARREQIESDIASDKLAALEADIEARRKQMESDIASDMERLRSEMESDILSDIERLKADQESALESDMAARRSDMEAGIAAKAQRLEEELEKRRAAIQEELSILREAAGSRRAGGGRAKPPLEIESGKKSEGRKGGAPSKEERVSFVKGLLMVNAELSGAEIARLVSEHFGLPEPIPARTGQRDKDAALGELAKDRRAGLHAVTGG